MASIRAQIRLNRNGKTVFTESQTYNTRALAKAWATKREAELAAQKVFKPKEDPLKVSEIIQEY